MIKVEIILRDGRKMRAELYSELAPKTVDNFINLVKKEYYNGLIFHRVIPNFMIQGGGMTMDMQEKGGLTPIKGEFSSNGWDDNLKISHEPGVLSMARTGDPNSASCQFFIVTGDAKFLDGQYAAFGKLIDEESLAVALDIQEFNTHSVGMYDDVPVEQIVIEKVNLI